MSTDEKLDDVQQAFLDASTKREVQVKLHDRDGGEHTLTIRRWSFSQQIQLGNSLTNIIHNVIQQLPFLLGSKPKGEEEVKVTVADLLSSNYNIGAMLEKMLPDIKKVCAGSLAHNFSGSIEKADAFVESLDDLSEVLELLLLIGSLNMLRDTAKKKYVSLANLFRSVE